MTTPTASPVSTSPGPFSAVHHSPIGAWASLFFGMPLRGATLIGDGGAEQADLLIAWQREGGGVWAFPFVERAADYSAWQLAGGLGGGELTRRLTPCVDEYALAGGAESPGVTLRVYTPHAALPNPKRSGNLQYATAPGVLLELAIDNSASDAPVTGFIGLRTASPLRPLDWSSKTLVGVGRGSHWLLAAPALKEETSTLQARQTPDRLSGGIDPAGNFGGIVVKVPARTTKVLPVVFAAYAPGLVTQGIDARYFYTNYFPRIEAVANFLLHNGQRVRESCASLDARLAGAIPEQGGRLALFSHAIRAYEASTQVLDGGTPAGAAGPAAYFATIAPGGHRDELSRAVCNLPWELYRNPWVIRNLFDLATSAYAYHDRVRFPGDESPDEPREGGMTFARVFGHGSAYAPGAPGTPAMGGGGGGAGTSAFDSAGSGPGFAGGRFATDTLLDAIYLLTSYALLADDTPWAKTRLPFARELLTSLENRDHWDPEQRTGILKAESLFAEGGEQIGLLRLPARGSLYIAIKTFCANLMLTTYFQNNNDLHSADYSYAFAQKTARSLVAAFDQTQLPANLLAPSEPGRFLGALEPLATPTYLGLTSTLAEYFPELHGVLKAHALACMKNVAEGGCVDASSGILRLLNHSSEAAPGAVIGVAYVLDRLFGIDAAAQAPGLWEVLLAQGGAAPADLIASALFMKGPAPGA